MVYLNMRYKSLNVFTQTLPVMWDTGRFLKKNKNQSKAGYIRQYNQQLSDKTDYQQNLKWTLTSTLED